MSDIMLCKMRYQINMKFGYPIIEIGSLQLFGGSEYGNL